jgi:hypothetical protein
MLKKSKNIVVAQRDGWSDHNRITEALSSGATILADDTVVLPRGLRHGESLVIFFGLAGEAAVLSGARR